MCTDRSANAAWLDTGKSKSTSAKVSKDGYFGLGRSVKSMTTVSLYRLTGF
jgi:hypothetical protein